MNKDDKRRIKKMLDGGLKMDTREKLIELISQVQYQGNAVHGYSDKYIQNGELADYLIASGFFEELQNEAYDLGADSALHNHFGLSWEDAAGLRKEVKRLQDATRWIPVTERLPEENTAVLTYRESGINVEFRWQRGWDNDEFTPCPVTHWMPPPEPPKGGS